MQIIQIQIQNLCKMSANKVGKKRAGIFDLAMFIVFQYYSPLVYGLSRRRRRYAEQVI